MIEVLIVKAGMIASNIYIVYDKDSLDTVIIDAGGGYDLINDKINSLRLNVKGLLITHGHFDHIWIAKKLQDDGIKVYIHRDDADKLPENNNFNMRRNFPRLNADVLLEEGDLALGSLNINVVHTPGHSRGGVCYIIEDAMFTGDTLFRLNVGRTDFIDGSQKDLLNSIKNKLFKLKKDYKIYPGHDRPTTLFYEKENNPYV